MRITSRAWIAVLLVAPLFSLFVAPFSKAEGLDDGPEYSPNGKYIYFNSFRTGKMQIWRMLADGSAPEQEKTLPKRNRWRDLLPGSSSEWETDGELNMIKKNSIMVPRLKGSQLPYKATEGSAAYDLRAPINATVMPGGRLVLDLNLSAAIPEGYALQLSSRSGLASQGLWTLAGVIDSDYRGSIKAILFNSNSSAFKIAKGQRITQAFLFRTYEVDWQEVGQLPSTNRGDGGLGSTGKA